MKTVLVLLVLGAVISVAATLLIDRFLERYMPLEDHDQQPKN